MPADAFTAVPPVSVPDTAVRVSVATCAVMVTLPVEIV
jgi:hypothetical protein